MKRIVFAVITAAALPAFAADPTYSPDCHLDGINQAIDGAIDQIKSSPAYGHAGGHYGKAHKDLENVKKQLAEGCKAWQKGGEKTGKPAAAPAK